MRFLGRFIFFLLVLLLTFLFHIFFSYTLPAPFNTMNMAFIVLFFMLWWKEAGSIVWTSFFLHFFFEFVSDLPFGITTFSGTMSILAGYWLYMTVFTNRSWYGISLLLLVSIVIFRLLFIILLLLHSFVFDSSLSLPALARFSLWEAASTGFVFLCLSALMSRFFVHFRPERIR